LKISAARRPTALDDLLARAAPRLATGPGADLLGGDDPLIGTIAAIATMDGTLLPMSKLACRF
jgi:uncharacterized protein